jgi:hypothetical protein
VAGHQLIDASVLAMARRLPADAVDELADGLTETYERHLSRGLHPDAAADAAIAEFGEPDLVVAAFVRQSPGRLGARALLCVGPTVGACWGAALVTGHAWSWSAPVPLRLGFGLALLAVVTALVLAATARRNYRLTRMTAVGGLGLIALDMALLAYVLLVGAPFTWPLAVATAASLTRVTVTARILARLRTG